MLGRRIIAAAAAAGGSPHLPMNGQGGLGPRASSWKRGCVPCENVAVPPGAAVAHGRLSSTPPACARGRRGWLADRRLVTGELLAMCLALQLQERRRGLYPVGCQMRISPICEVFTQSSSTRKTLQLKDHKLSKLKFIWQIYWSCHVFTFSFNIRFIRWKGVDNFFWIFKPTVLFRVSIVLVVYVFLLLNLSHQVSKLI